MRPGVTAILFGVLVLSACKAVGPDYTPPPVTVSERYAAAVPAFAGQGDVDAAKWWRAFDDALLTALVERALADNLSIKAAESRVREARALIGSARAAGRPTLDLGADAGVEYSREYGDDNDRERGATAGTDLSLGWPIDLFGRTQRSVEAAEAERLRAEALYFDAALAVAAETARTYLELRGAEARLSYSQESLELQRRTLEIVRGRVDSGLAPRLDLTRAQASVASLQADLAPIETEIERSITALAVLTGVPPGELDLALRREGRQPDLAAGPALGAPAELLRRRPDVQAAEFALKRSVAEIGIAEAEFYPLLRLPGSLGYGVTGVGSGEVVRTLMASLAGTLQVPLFDGGRREAEFDAARARAAEALYAYRATVLDALGAVENAAHGYAGARRRVDALAAEVDANEQVYEQARVLYQQGLASFLDVLDAQRQLTESRQDIAAAETEVSLEAVTLYEAAGFAPELAIAAD